jgi:hypothetical protein
MFGIAIIVAFLFDNAGAAKVCFAFWTAECGVMRWMVITKYGHIFCPPEDIHQNCKIQT